MAYTFTSDIGIRYIIDDALIRKVNDKVLILEYKTKMGEDLYVNFYIDKEHYRVESLRYEDLYVEVEGSGTKFGHDGRPVEYYDPSKVKYYDKEVYNETTGKTDTIRCCDMTYELRISEYHYYYGRYVIHNNNIYEEEFWIPDTVINVNIDMGWIFGSGSTPTVHIGKNVKTLQISTAYKLIKDDDAVNTSLEKLVIYYANEVIKLRNCVNLDYIYLGGLFNIDGFDIYVDKKYKSLSKKKWTHDNCLLTDIKTYNGSSLDKVFDYKELFNRVLSDEADNYMCVQTDEAVVQIPLYIVQDGQSIDVDNALLIKEDDGVYYCPVTKEKTDKSIMAIQSTDCVYYVDSE